MQRIRRTSRTIVWVCMAIVVLLPVALVDYWVTASVVDLAVHGNLSASAIQAHLLVWQRVAAAVVTAVPLAMLLLGVWQVKSCFEQFAQGSVFTAQATAHLRRFAGWVAAAALVWVMADVISQGQALAEENERFI